MIGITTGVDLLRIDRLTRLNPAVKERFLLRVFTTREVDACANRDSSLAGHFAAKEAAAKALGCGIGEVGWKDIEILNDANGKPLLLLHNAAQSYAETAGWISWSVSISHTMEFAIATVTALFEQL